MATPGGVNGCIFDTDASQPLGALSTGIGFGTASVMGPPDTSNFTADAVPALNRIGGATGTLASIGAPTKAMKVKKNTTTGSIANGAAFSDTYVNNTGSAVPPGGYCVATAP